MTGPRRRVLITAGVFAAVVGTHFAWFTTTGPQTRWLSVEDDPQASPLWFYLESGMVWLGLSYALSLSFAAGWLARYRADRLCAARTLSVGGVTLSGFLAVAGCYALGCCGSPMLGVYLSFFGAAFLPLTKPLVFVFTTISLAGGWWWMRRHEPGAPLSPSSSACDFQ